MSEKILVVEDSRAFRNYLYQQFKNDGYDVSLAESVAEAKAILEQETDFLCAVLDYCLPDGQDGEIIDLVLGYQQKNHCAHGHVQQHTSRASTRKRCA